VIWLGVLIIAAIIGSYGYIYVKSEIDVQNQLREWKERDL